MKTIKQLEKEFLDNGKKALKLKTPYNEYEIRTREIEVQLQTLKEVLKELDKLSNKWVHILSIHDGIWIKKDITELKAKLVGE